jgi:hypothetical protein
MRLITMTTGRKRAGILAWTSAWIGRRQRELSDRLHAAADERASQHGWEVRKSTGQFGFGARTYRDPRFNDRCRQDSPAGALRGQPRVGPGGHPERPSGGSGRRSQR